MAQAFAQKSLFRNTELRSEIILDTPSRSMLATAPQYAAQGAGGRTSKANATMGGAL
jgi:hypothetical protein